MITELFGQTGILTNYLLYGTICLGAGLIAAWLFRRSAARAHQVLLLAMAAALIVPVTSTLVSHYEIGIFSVDAAPAQIGEDASTIMAELVLPATVEFAEPEFQYGYAAVERHYSESAGSVVMPPAPSLAWRSILLGLWFAASAMLLIRLAITFVLGRSLLKKAVPVCGAIRQSAETAAEKLAVDKPIVVLVSEKVTGCVIWCWTKRPALLIPRSAEVEDKDTDWVALFSHELAHLQRLDHISGLFAELLVCIFPWQPLVWISKKRLMALSEQACDDWAIAAANSDAGYARSLLDMVPQSKPAFAPTVLPNRRHLTARIQRILHGRRSNPRAGRGWALLAVVTAMFLAVTISFAQPRPADDREIDRAEQHEREEAEERERLEVREHVEAAELRERRIHARELQQRAKEIERHIKGLRDDQDEEARELEAELREIREHIASMRRDLGDGRGLESDLRARKADPHFRELMLHRAELQKRAREIQLALKEHPDHPEKAELHAAMDEIEAQMHSIERELRGPGAEGRPVDGRRADLHLRELMQHREELQVRTEQVELELRELGDTNPDRSHQLRGEMEDIANAMETIERKLQAVRRDREPGDARNRKLMQRRAELAERELLMRHRKALQVRAEQVGLELRELGDADTDEAHEFRMELDKTIHELRRIEEQLHRIDQMARSWPGAKDPGAGAEEARLRELMQEREGLGERAGQIERKLKEIGDSRPDETHELRKQLDDVGERMRDIEAQMHGQRREGDPDAHEHHIPELMERRRQLEAHARETEILIDKFENEEDKAAERRTLEDIHRQMEEIDRELRGAESRGIREGGDIGNEVDRLRGEVNELRNQMGEIRSLLERLLERERPQRTDKRRDDTLDDVQF